MSVTLTQAMTDLSYLLGETSVPTSGTEDRQRFIQVALERAYRAYNFPFNKINATVQAVAGIATLPTNIMQDGSLDIRDITASPDITYKEVDYTEFDRYDQGAYVYWVDGYEGRYVAHTSEISSSPILTVRYTSSVPVINASIATPFPSSMALARGALIYYRQAEDPQADISQEEALFQVELEEVISAYNRNRGARRLISSHESSRTYIGDIGYD